MTAQKTFWNEIQRMRRGADRAEQIRPLTAKDYETFYGQVRALHGAREAAAFAQLSAAIQENCRQSVLQALHDLKEQGWDVGRVFAAQDRRLHAARRATLTARDYFGYLSRHDATAYPACAYTRTRPLAGYDTARKTFLAAHFSELLPEQRVGLKATLRGYALE